MDIQIDIESPEKHFLNSIEGITSLVLRATKCRDIQKAFNLPIDDTNLLSDINDAMYAIRTISRWYLCKTESLNNTPK
jgi:hypothetical protein